MNQKGTFYTSGQTNKPSDLNKKITYSSNLPEEKAFKYSTISKYPFCTANIKAVSPLLFPEFTSAP